MPVEAPLPYHPHNSETSVTVDRPVLEDFLLTTLEQLDGFCLDNESDRVELALLLATVLTQATRSGALIVPPFPLEPTPRLETSDDSAVMPPFE